MKPNDQLEPTVFVIFGGAGDLTWRKLIPALFDLSQDRSLPAQFAIIAVDRIKFHDENVCAFFNESLGALQRQAARSTRDDCNLTFKLSHNYSLR